MKKTSGYCIGLIIILIFVSHPLFSSEKDIYNIEKYETDYKFQPVEKDPFLAGLLSWMMMGIGQFYCGEYTKGSIFIAADLINKGAMVLLISHINTKYSLSETDIINWKKFDDGTKFLIISYFAGTIGVKFYSVIDAIQSANHYNEKYFSKRDQKSFSFNFDRDSFSLSYSFKFSE